MAIELTWTGKDEAIAESQSSPEGFVDFRGVDFVSDNIYVEGDNLNVLKTMRHYVPPGMDGGKEFDPHPFVDMIYIDPPYNTGGKSFVYNDRYASEGWLSMMYPRLALAKEILKPEGVIFVSIDKNEVDYLKVVMDEIFGRKNFMIPFVWRKKSGGGNDTTAGYTTHEYILTYGGGGKVKKFRVPLEPHQLEAYGNWDSDPRGDYKLESWKLRRGHYEPRLNRRYTIKHPTDGREVNEKWSGSQEEYEALVADNRIYWPSGRSLPNEKKFLSERVEEGITPTSIIDHSSFMTMSGRKDLIALELAAEAVGGHRRLYFDFPKPVSLITYLLQLAGEECYRDGLLCGVMHHRASRA